MYFIGTQGKKEERGVCLHEQGTEKNFLLVVKCKCGVSASGESETFLFSFYW